MVSLSKIAPFALNDFLCTLPDQLIDLTQVLNKFNLHYGFVGGVVRDFYSQKKIVHDIDIEFFKPDEREGQSLGAFEKELKKIDKSCEKLRYGVFRLSLPPYTVELAPARVEKYQQHKIEHRNFSAIYLHWQDRLLAAKRRDFTINAMGVYYDQSHWHFIDPYDGLTDWKKKNLQACSEDFTKDPIRKLRAFRFALNFGFSFDPRLDEKLKTLSCESVTSFYFLREWEKTSFDPRFLKLLIDYTTKPSGRFYEVVKSLSSILSTPLYEELRGFSLDQLSCFYLVSLHQNAETLVTFFSWPRKKWKKQVNALTVIIQSTEYLSNLKKIVTGHCFDVIKNDAGFKRCYECYRLLEQWNWDYKELSLLEYLLLFVERSKTQDLKWFYNMALDKKHNIAIPQEISLKERNMWIFFHNSLSAL